MTRIVLGVQGAQSPSNRGRGIARYVLEHVRALFRVAPEAIAAVQYDPGLPLDEVLESLPSALPWLPAPRPVEGEELVYHVMSPFEEMSLDMVWPVWARAARHPLAVTLYDLIPLLYGERYLVTSRLRTFYAARLGLLRTADAVLAISQGTADDAVRLLGTAPGRLTSVGAGCADFFSPAPAGHDAFATARSLLPELRPGFFLYVGGLDPRKNVHGLLAAYARLDERLRAEAQMVIACRPETYQARDLRRHARRLNLGRSVLLTGFVSDELLLALYRSCRMTILASGYEGFGLTALEAMRCGAAAAVSDIPSLRDLVPDPEARFDPLSIEAIAAVLSRAISDPAFLARRKARGPELAAAHTWDRVARASLEAYGKALRVRSPAIRSSSFS